MLPCDEQREICKDFSVLWATFEPLAMNGPLSLLIWSLMGPPVCFPGFCCLPT
ncbi:hypothetical protein LEMLEM_LOCUS4918, partial [Lemmus lemmus]